MNFSASIVLQKGIELFIQKLSEVLLRLLQTVKILLLVYERF